MQPIEQRLTAVRAEMAALEYDALVIPRADEYLGEYLPPHNERLRWLTGFTGSAGDAVVLAESAAMFVDGRYTVQVRKQVPAHCFDYLHLIETPPRDWLVERLSAGARVALDPRMHSLQWYRELSSILEAAGLALVETPDNLVDRCWHDRPDPLVEPALLLGEEFTGRSRNKEA